MLAYVGLWNSQVIEDWPASGGWGSIFTNTDGCELYTVYLDDGEWVDFEGPAVVSLEGSGKKSHDFNVSDSGRCGEWWSGGTGSFQDWGYVYAIAYDSTYDLYGQGGTPVYLELLVANWTWLYPNC
jgi:hypothetical protein